MWKAKDLECSQGAETQKIDKFLGRGDLVKWSKRTKINRGDVYVSFNTQQNIGSQMWKAKDLECSQGAETQKLTSF